MKLRRMTMKKQQVQQKFTMDLVEELQQLRDTEHMMYNCILRMESEISDLKNRVAERENEDNEKYEEDKENNEKGEGTSSDNDEGSVHEGEGQDEVAAIAAATAMQISDNVNHEPPAGFVQCVMCATSPPHSACNYCDMFKKAPEGRRGSSKEGTNSHN